MIYLKMNMENSIKYYFTFLALQVLAFLVKAQVIILKESALVKQQLNSSTYRLISDDFVTPSTDFFIPQCHSRQHNFTMYQIGAHHQFHVDETGFSIGDVIFAGDNSALYVNKTSNSTFNVYCTYTRFTKSDPIPGGCNLEYNFENDPNIHTWYDGFHLWVEFQYSNVDDLPCDNSQNYSRLTYSIYALYFDVGNSDEDFTDTLTKYLSGDPGPGTKLLDHVRTSSSKPATVITSYPDQPLLVSVVVSDTLTGGKATYVSTVSYGCDVNKHTPDHPCQIQWYYYLLASVLGLIGLFLTFAAHRYFYCEVFIYGFLTVLFCSFIGLLIARVPPSALLAGSVGAGLLGGALWLTLWYAAGIATLNAALSAANAGFLVSSIAFYTPLVNLSMFDNKWEIWLMYPIPVVLVVLVFLFFAKKVNIASCAFLGSYMVVSAVSVYSNASLHHILLETIRRATIYQYYDVVFSAPFSAKDVGLLVCWVILLITGCAIQLYTEKEKPDFPISPRKRVGDRTSVLSGEEERLLASPESPSRTPAPDKSYGAINS